MNDLLKLVQSALSSGDVDKLASQLGIDPAVAQGGIARALPMILGGLQNNTQSPEGAASLHAALERDHDGSVLQDINQQFEHGATADGQAILGHVFGGQQQEVAQQLGQTSGLDMSQAGNLMAMLAPVVLGMLGQQQRSAGLDANGLANMLGGGQQGGIMGLVSGFLDQNHDGNVMDDVSNMLGNFFGKKG